MKGFYKEDYSLFGCFWNLETIAKKNSAIPIPDKEHDKSLMFELINHVLICILYRVYSQTVIVSCFRITQFVLRSSWMAAA